ncbi:MAG TPA: NAD(P)-dependent oxidoreductase [Pirellulales bacterium]|nr:NAD(P)-dependent oxidoreductase [Pirellulales bacterium]
MQIAVTGATGFLGRYIVARLLSQGFHLRCWRRETSDLGGFDAGERLNWVVGDLSNADSASALVAGCDAVVHAALFHPGGGFRGGEGDVIEFAERNVLGTLRLIEAARAAGARRFVFVSTCAVHEKILSDRPLDETHPTWATSHYGAHKAALEQFVHSYGWGQGYEICAVRPTGIYGLARPAEQSKWFSLVRDVARGKPVQCTRGGKEVHAADVAQAIELLLKAPGISGEAFNCYDRYISEYEVATIARRLSGGKGEILGQPTAPKHQIETGKLRDLGMQFGGEPLLEQTVGELLAAVRG